MNFEKYWEMLGIKERELWGDDLFGVLHTIFREVSKIWRQPDLYDFTDHGIRHSFEAARHALRLSDALRPDDALTDFERFVLGAAALLHDIGMQACKHTVQGESLSKDDARSRHADIGYRWVRELINEPGTYEARGLPDLVERSDQPRRWLTYAADVGFAHSSESLWTRLRDSDFNPIPLPNGVLYRPRLLAALLRLGDELDCAYDRVPEPDRISSSLAIDHKAHWYTCYFIESVNIQPNAGAIVTIHWRHPADAHALETKAIQRLVTRRMDEFAEEYYASKEFLRLEATGGALLVEPPTVTPPAKRTLKHLPDELIEFAAEIREVPEAAAADAEVPYPNQLFGADNLWEQAKEFVEQSGTARYHVRLKTGWHTDYFLSCKDLLQRLEFARGLTRYLESEYRDMSFSQILAIGTAGIMLGGSLHLALRCALAYTFDPVLVPAYGTQKHPKFERDFDIPDGARVLVVDDIIGVGSASKAVLDEIYSKCTPDLVHFFAVYRLGEKPISRDTMDGKNIDYLHWYRNVNYWKADTANTCDHCPEDRTKILDEWAL